jgi:hypothetical protein
MGEARVSAAPCFAVRVSHTLTSQDYLTSVPFLRLAATRRLRVVKVTLTPTSPSPSGSSGLGRRERGGDGVDLPLPLGVLPQRLVHQVSTPAGSLESEPRSDHRARGLKAQARSRRPRPRFPLQSWTTSRRAGAALYSCDYLHA